MKMIITCGRVAIVIAALIVASSQAWSQTVIRAIGGDGTSWSYSSPMTMFSGRGSSGSLSLLQMPQYHKELDLSEEQIERIREVQKDIQRQTTEIFRSTARLGGDAGLMIKAANAAIREKADEQIKIILLPHQIKRLNQLRVQAQIRARGASSLLDKDLFSVLRLTEKQMEELAEKQREAQKELQEQIKKLTLKYRQGVIRDVLTTEQLKKLEQLTGEPYEAQTTRAIPSGSFFQEFPLILGHSHWAVTNKNVRRGLRIFVMVVA